MPDNSTCIHENFEITISLPHKQIENLSALPHRQISIEQTYCPTDKDENAAVQPHRHKSTVNVTASLGNTRSLKGKVQTVAHA